ncbi:hypothetical protein BKA70DRAFT_1278156 [Coprinopsis sp. MPI-PUGE-AT-0042]|nr:hypothetical protein BKA70DRAFT_1278156 [Coprinopsis sp. MPI-PUGE-AT-0042]
MALPTSSQLPDEIIKEILYPGLHVPDALFADCTFREDPFAKYDLSSSTVLVVCKSWLRVATPLLYETVVLRSKAQAQRLAWVLKNNNQLGPFIKKLRVEGGYGNSMFEILKRSPHTTDLSLSTALFSNESVTGYLKGFRLVNPKRLIVRDDGQFTGSKVRQQVYEALAEAAKDTWNAMKAVYLLLPEGNSTTRASVLAEGLTRGSSPIEYIRIYGCTSASLHLSFVQLLRLSTMREMRIFTWKRKPPFDSNNVQSIPGLVQFERALLADRKLYEMVSYEHPLLALPPASSVPAANVAAHTLPAPLNPHWRPLLNASPEIRDLIWTKILCYAMSLSSPGTSSISLRHRTSWQKFRAELALVCKEFARLATPLMYKIIIVTRLETIDHLRFSPHKHLIREVWLQIDYWKAQHTFFWMPSSLSSLLAGCTNLVALSGCRTWLSHESDAGPEPRHFRWNSTTPSHIPIPWRTLNDLSAHSSVTLQHLNIAFKMDKEEATFEELDQIIVALSCLRQLRSLGLCGRKPVSLVSGTTTSRFPSDCFPLLERLAVAFPSPANLPLMEALAGVELPSLTWLELRPEDTRGNRLLHAITTLTSASFMEDTLSELPCLETWRIIWASSEFYNLDCLATVPAEGPDFAMTRIEFIQSCGSDGSCPPQCLLSANFSSLKKLESIRLSHLEWPTSQRDIDRSVWVSVAEALLKKWNIKLLNKHGKGWIPRLKPTTNRRRNQ